jgi:phosphoribosylaminoimidazolecarboxamide formyltransferase/IMP cyclohydrolase
VAAIKPIKRALISVYDQSRLSEIGKILADAGVEILATSATAKTLVAAGVPVIEVSSYTQFPEILNGRIKTLHPRIHAGVLADQDDPEHVAALAELTIKTFDLVIINLYPFLETINSEANFDECIEQIDIGGPTILRGAAKNHSSVATISSPNQYDELIAAIQNGGFTLDARKDLAMKSFIATAEYDMAIANWLAQRNEFPKWFSGAWRLKGQLRYGENQHQKAAIYASPFPGIASAELINGKEMSFNNYTDADAAWRTALDHQGPSVAIIKHANPCGVAIGKSIADAYKKALSCDSVSAYGGVVALNRKIDLETAKLLSENFIEVLIAPDFEDAALNLLAKKPNLRILRNSVTAIGLMEVRPITGGLLLQESDLVNMEGDQASNWKQVSGAKVSAEIMADLEFAWRAIRSIKSNAVLLAKDGASVGIGMGQVNRIDSSKLAIQRAGDRSIGSVAASDGFFPFADGLEVLLNSGVVAVVQPGGSIRDEEVIAAAKAKNIPMFFTGVRHFSHA